MSKQQQDNYEAMIKAELEREDKRGVDTWFKDYCSWYKQVCKNVGVDFDKVEKREGN